MTLNQPFDRLSESRTCSAASVMFDKWWDEHIQSGYVRDTSKGSYYSHWYAFVGALQLVLPDKHPMWDAPRKSRKREAIAT